jgi:SAM-dependent methyltransferase
VRAVNRIIRQHRVHQVLEVAPGPGRLSCHVSGFERGVLCDANLEMLTVARLRLEQPSEAPHGPASHTHGAWRTVAGDAFRLPFRDTFDLVYTFRFLRHFEPRDRSRLYAQIGSRLRPGGLFVFDAVNASVALPIRRNEGNAAYPIYDALYQRESLLHELRQHGFDVLGLIPVMRHMRLQHLIQVVVGPRSTPVAHAAIRWLEWLPGHPLEWIVVAQKSATATCEVN